MAPADSASMARLCRSEVVVRSISSMMAGTLSAFETCAIAYEGWFYWEDLSPSRSTTGRGFAKYNGTTGMFSAWM